MSDYNVVLPSKPRVIEESNFIGRYEIDGLYPGYGHTLGNSLRRIILSSLPGAAITSIKIAGVDHEFSTIAGVKEDVINIILNLKKVRIEMLSDEPLKLSLKVKGVKNVTAADIDAPGQVKILNPEAPIANITDKGTELSIEMTVEKGLGYVAKEVLHKDKVDIGTIALDAIFTPIHRVNYEVENMRVGNRTDFNKLNIFIQTDGTVTPRFALEKSIEIMITQLKAIVGFKEDVEIVETSSVDVESSTSSAVEKGGEYEDILKTRTESLELSARTINALANANIRTVGGLVRKKEKDILEIEGLGGKGVEEIKKMLSDLGLSLKA
ncbi:MAG: DNA-directed RNA polymerase subunit alpha [Candidatus Pacebacteria bacterium]|nr:DNA-directed RNA polymerase subunit alpha [Candidatus Paceibacterota bacterium]